MAPLCAHDCFHTHWRWSRHFNNEESLGWGPGPNGAYTVPGAPMVRANQTVRVATTMDVPGFRYHASAAAQPPDDWMVVMPHGAAYAIAVRMPPAVLAAMLDGSGLPPEIRAAIAGAAAVAGHEAAFAWFYFLIQYWPQVNPLLTTGKLGPPLDVIKGDVAALMAL